MKRRNLAVGPATCALLAVAVGHAESRAPMQWWKGRSRQPTGFSNIIRVNVPRYDFAQGTADHKRNKKQDNVLDRSVVQKLYQAVLLVKSVCNGEKSQAERVADVGKGLRDLLDITTKYKRMEPRLKMHT